MRLDDPRLIGQLLQSQLLTALAIAAALGFMLWLLVAVIEPTFARINAALTAAQEIAHHVE